MVKSALTLEMMGRLTAGAWAKAFGIMSASDTAINCDEISKELDRFIVTSPILFGLRSDRLLKRFGARAIVDVKRSFSLLSETRPLKPAKISHLLF